jgi:hypothetical protein
MSETRYCRAGRDRSKLDRVGAERFGLDDSLRSAYGPNVLLEGKA